MTVAPVRPGLLVLLAIAVAAMAAGTAGAAGKLSDAAAALASDPVYVDPLAERAISEATTAGTLPVRLIDLRATIDSHLLAVASIEASHGSRDTVARLIDQATVAVADELPAFLASRCS